MENLNMGVALLRNKRGVSRYGRGSRAMPGAIDYTTRPVGHEKGQLKARLKQVFPERGDEVG
ncbi:MAG: hypothetical protein AUJ55_03770 [Proteobacteria bacterium CG1_02_64_396]|nr:MAG: hypothetical protein AUJ55_03770 [Proteobacteria bacterium CG1_02_64_396]